MFEGWAADVLASYLGKYLDLPRDRLRISLWGGGLYCQHCLVFLHSSKCHCLIAACNAAKTQPRRGCMLCVQPRLGHASKCTQLRNTMLVYCAGEGILEDVQLRVEAFEYLQLPFAIKEGSVGRLKLQVRCNASAVACICTGFGRST